MNKMIDNYIINIKFVKVDFKCPHCNKKYSDLDDKYLKRLNKNKKHWTNIKCSCGEIFGMTYDYTSKAVGFKL